MPKNTTAVERERLKKAIALLTWFDEHLEHKPVCPLFDLEKVRQAKCICYKRRITKFLQLDKGIRQ